MTTRVTRHAYLEYKRHDERGCHCPEAAYGCAPHGASEWGGGQRDSCVPHRHALDRSDPAAGLREAIERETDAVYPAASPAGPRTPWQDGWNAAMERIDEILAASPTASPTEDADTP